MKRYIVITQSRFTEKYAIMAESAEDAEQKVSDEINSEDYRFLELYNISSRHIEEKVIHSQEVTDEEIMSNTDEYLRPHIMNRINTKWS
jgi:hypothetical protein